MIAVVAAFSAPASHDDHADHADSAAVATTDIEAKLQSIVQIAAGNPDFSTLVSVLTSPAQKSVLDALSGDGPFTVFAPTNAAFAKIAEVLPTLTNEDITKVLLLHAAPGATYSKDIPEGTTPVTTAGGGIVNLVNEADGITFGGASVVAADIAASNGVIHVIDSVVTSASN